MRILYGIQGHYKDVTELAINNFKYECLCTSNGRFLRIPSQDFKREQVFEYKILEKNILKHIFLNGEKKGNGVLYINLDLHEKMSPASNIRNKLGLQINNDGIEQSPMAPMPFEIAKQKLYLIHSSLALNHISFNMNFDFQIQCMMHIKPNSNVLLIDENMKSFHIPLIISSILFDDSNFVVLCNKDEQEKIKENRELNEFNFKIENIKEFCLDFNKFNIIVICNDSIIADKLDNHGFQLNDSYSEISDKGGNKLWVLGPKNE
jgi:hypothetical protein